MPIPSDNSPPRLTPADLLIPGRIKVEPEDFCVVEIPAYEPSGSGEHLYLRIRKRDLAAEQLQQHLARSLQVPRDSIGMAGLKDRWAVTEQWVSVPAQAESRLNEVEAPNVQILQSGRHGNKLRTGHLRGNQFMIRIRPPTAGWEFDPLERVQLVLQRLLQTGVPNFFGDQRRGVSGETLELGLGLLRGERSPRDIPYSRRKFLLRLAHSAVQSELFNALLAQRIDTGTFQQVQQGDILQLLPAGGMFLAEDAAAEQTRLDQREVGITGPLFGPRMKMPGGVVADWEQALLMSFQLTSAHFEQDARLTPGGRRQLSIWLADATAQADPDGVLLRFTLPPGAYATVVLREFVADPGVGSPEKV